MNRLYGQVGVRLAAVGLLLAGVAGGVHLGRDQQAQQQSAEVDLVVAADTAEIDLLKERQAAHAAARVAQRKAEADAAAEASREAKAAAIKARKRAKAVLKKKAAAKAAASKARTGGDGPSKPFTGPIPKSCNEYRGNRRIGCAVLLGRGFGLGQMPCLDKLWQKESGWNSRATNRSSGAYGIPQALPGGKMASAGSDWRTSAATQIKWGLGYIKGRYDTPCGAWSHSRRVGWY